MRARLLVLFMIGCGGGGISIEDLPDELEGAQCDRLVACQFVKDRATCEAGFNFDDEEYRSIAAGVEDGTIKYNEGKADACADAFGDTNCSFDGFHQDNACDDIFTGTVPTGGACVIDLQCANRGNCQVTGACNPDVSCCQGTCMGSFTESPLGGPCEDDLHFCATSAYCKEPATGPGTCTALVTNEGGTCDAIDGCANPMYCNLSFTTGTGTCKRSAASGATCTRMDLFPCADSRDFCDATTMKCIRDLAVGAACGTGTSCVAYASCVNGSCTADIAAGGACVIDSGADCAGSLECISGTCALPPVGMTCALP